MERRLTAILVADVVGYSRLMGANETETLTALKGHRAELFDPRIAEHKGRVVKLMGDGALVNSPASSARFSAPWKSSKGWPNGTRVWPGTGGSSFASASTWAT